MPHMILKVKAKKVTTREGNHPDDEAYLEQVQATVELRLIELGFHNPEVELVWGP